MPMLEWHKSANWLIIYEWLSSLISPAVAVYRGTRPRVSANASASIGIRDYLGWNLPSERSCQPGDVTIWIHAASVGEASSAIKALQSVRERGLQYKPRLRAVLSAGNASGLSYLKDWSHGQYVECVLLPVDSPQTARLFLDWARPQCGVFVEGDLWPALMAEARRRMIPLALIEARISDRSWRRWNSIPPGRAMASNIYRSLTRVACGDPSQGEQLQWLGAPAPMILPTIKFARIRTPRSGSVTQRPRKQELLRSLVQGKIPWLAASIHAGEEDLVLKSHVVIIKELRARSKPEPLLIVAPRHPLRLLERILSSCEELQLDSTAVATWTELCERPPENPSVISVLIVDTLGEMDLFYPVAPLTVIGNSLCPPGGGHNFAEAAHEGCALIVGPYVGHFHRMISLVEEAADPKESPIIQALPETLPQRVVDALLDLPHLRIQGTSWVWGCSESVL